VPKLLLNLRNVPDDESLEVLALMEEHRIEVYQTPPGPFGITAGGIWLKQVSDFDRARKLLDEYQAERARSARAEWEQARREGRAETLWQAIRRQPVKILVFTGLAVFILMVFFAPLIELRRAVGG
jgi:nitrogenase molybdenum-iron protein alpha/beta subunit